MHGVGIRFINRWFSSAWVRVDAATRRSGGSICILTAAIAALSMLHFAETLLWALPISRVGHASRMRDSLLLRARELHHSRRRQRVSCRTRWRLLGPIIAMSGLFTFGWTGSVLVSIMAEFGRLDRAARARKASDDDGPDDRPA